MNQHVRIAAESAGIDGARPVPSGIFRHADVWLGHPAWLRAGTSLGPGMLPLFVPLAEALRLAANVVAQGQQPLLITLALQQQGTPINPMAAALLDQAPDAGAALAAVARYFNATHPHLLLLLSRHEGQVAVSLRVRQPVPHGSFTLFSALLVALIGRYLQRFGAPASGQLTITVPGFADALSAGLGVAVAEVRTAACRIAMPAAAADRPNPGHDPILWQVALDRLADLEQAAARPDLPSRLDAVIAETLDRHGRLPTLAETSRRLGMSERTLSRRLADLGIGLRDIAERQRERRARQMIAETRLGIDEIAARLGYPDRSSFTRHFRAWFGTSPARYRSSAG